MLVKLIHGPMSQMVPTMQKLSLLLFACGVFAAGYVLGSADALTVRHIDAAQEDERLSSDALLLYKQSRNELDKLGDTLVSEQRHQPAAEGENFFALSVGGIDCMRDLEEGRGVDPETFAALYAGRALPVVAQHIEIDDSGRIRYKGDIVRMYSRERLKKMFRLRDEIRNRAASISD